MQPLYLAPLVKSVDTVPLSLKLPARRVLSEKGSFNGTSTIIFHSIIY